MTTAGIILPGGGMQGVSQAGNLSALLPALKRNRIDLSYLGGTSVGGIQGAKISEGMTIDECISIQSETIQTWLAIERHGPEIIFPLTSVKFAWGLYSGAILDGTTLWGLVNGKLLGTSGIDPLKIMAAPRQFDLVVKNSLTFSSEVLSIQDQKFQKNPNEILNAIVAAASLPPFFPSQKVFETPYEDGRFIAPLVKRAIKAGCNFIFVLFPYQRRKMDRPTDWFSRSFPEIIKPLLRITAMSNEIDEAEIERAKAVAQDIRAQEKARNFFSTPWGKRKFDRAINKAGFTFARKRDLVICEVYIENKPSSLLVHTFDKKNKDLSLVLDSSENTMSKLLREMQLY